MRNPLSVSFRISIGKRGLDGSVWLKKRQMMGNQAGVEEKSFSKIPC
jgi:hypothetical protein